MTGRPIALALLLALAGLPRVAAAGESYHLVADADLSSLAGARSLASLTRGANRGVDLAFDPLLDLHPAAGIPIRIGRMGLIDAPLAIFAIWVQHEAFGHAARAREFGLAPHVTLVAPPPYGFDFDDLRTEWSSSAGLDLDRRILLTTEGQEAEALFMHQLFVQSLRSGKWRRALDFVILVRLAGDLRRFANPSSDWGTYQTLVQMQPGNDKLLEEWPGYVRWALDPLLWWALYDYFWCNLIQGRPAGPAPFLEARGLKFFLRPAWRLAPWGEDLGISAIAFTTELFAEAEILVGHRDGPPALLLSGSLTWLEPLPGVNLALRAGLWGQPQTTVVEWGYVPESDEPLPLTAGALLELEAELSVLEWGGLFVLVGMKSTGYVVGRAFDGGTYGQAGIILTL